jgi:hypothetical protein
VKRTALLVGLGLLIGILATTIVNKGSVNAQVIQSWSKDKVTPILFVKPGYGSFVPVDGNQIGISWTKDQVVPICLVKPSIAGFEPVEGTGIGNTWSKNEIKPVVYVQPYLEVFIPSGSAVNSSQTAIPTPVYPPVVSSSRSETCNPAIETHIAGDFNGWEGETLYKMDDGSIWQQSNYHYHYHYTYHPSVTIYPSSSGACHIKVSGDDDDGVDVVRIK